MYLKTLTILFLTVSLLFTNPRSAHAFHIYEEQTPPKISWREAKRNADAAFEQKKYALALDQYTFVLAERPNNIPAAYNAGIAAFELKKYSLAKKYLKDVAASTKAKKYPENAYYLGVTQKFLGEYKAAIENLDAFAGKYKNQDDATYITTLAHISGCSKSLSAFTKYTSRYVIQTVKAGINTPQDDKNGAAASDDKLVFTTMGDHSKAQIKIEKNGVITELTDQDIQVGSVFLADDKKIFFTKNTVLTNGNKRQTICSGEVNSKFEITNVLQLPAIINGTTANGWNTSDPLFTVNERGNKVMYFSTNRTGGLGGADIWSAVMLPNGQFTTPKNAGASINTTNDEISPFYDINKTALYFSSNRPEGSGGYDVYAAKKFAQYWKPANNLGFAINSSSDDVYFKLDKGAKTATLSSNRIGGLTANTDASFDIYQFTMNNGADSSDPKLNSITVSGNVLDKKTKSKIVDYHISLYQMIGEHLVLVNRIDGVSYYEFTLDVDKEYVIEVESDEVKIDRSFFDTTEIKEDVVHDVFVLR